MDYKDLLVPNFRRIAREATLPYEEMPLTEEHRMLFHQERYAELENRYRLFLRPVRLQRKTMAKKKKKKPSKPYKGGGHDEF